MKGAQEAGYVFRDRYPEREEIYRAFAETSDAARRQLPNICDIPYGDHPRQRFDLFFGAPTGPLLVFIHGGYWRSLAKGTFSFVARPFVEKGYAVAVVGYPLLPEIPFARICESLRLSVPAVVQALRDRGFHPTGWIISGHSAGGHLAAWLATAGAVEPGIPLQACLPISGIFDLAPLLETSLGEMLGLDREEAAAFSPIKAGIADTRLLAVVGTAETQAFRDQSAVYVGHWADRGGPSRLVLLSGRHHYDILCDLMQKRSELVDHLQRFIAPG
jgi:arylformamidase